MSASIGIGVTGGEPATSPQGRAPLSPAHERGNGKAGAFEEMVRGRQAPFSARTAIDALARSPGETEEILVPAGHAEVEEEAMTATPGLKPAATDLFARGPAALPAPAKQSADETSEAILPAAQENDEKQVENGPHEHAPLPKLAVKEQAIDPEPAEDAPPAGNAPVRKEAEGRAEPMPAVQALPALVTATPAPPAGKAEKVESTDPARAPASHPIAAASEASPSSSRIDADISNGGEDTEEKRQPSPTVERRTRAMTAEAENATQAEAPGAEAGQPRPAATVVSQQSIPAPAISPAGPAATVLAPMLAAAGATGAPSAFETFAQAPRPSAMQTLSIQLTPVELGTVEAKLRVAGAELSVELRVETHEAWRRLSSDHDEIVKALRDKGYDIGQVTILPPQANSPAAASRTDGAFGGTAFGRDQQMPSQAGGNGGQPGGNHPGGGNQAENGRNEGTDNRADYSLSTRPPENRGSLSGGLYI